MSSFGSYEIVEELHRTPFSYVCSARRAGAQDNADRTDFVIKVFETPDTDGDGQADENAIGTEHFIGRARLQQKLSQAQSRHWAHIHELGESGDKPFYVTDYFPRSAQKLILGRVNLGPAALHEIISSIVRGLGELRELCNQSHGCLKPANVLIGGAGEVSGAKIVLTDPSCATASGETEHGGDMHALGELIYQLVLHRPFHSTAWPIQESEEWSSLGKFADGWRELCNNLLNPDAATRPDAATLDHSLAALHPHGITVRQITHLPTAAARKVPVKKIAVSLAPLVLLMAGLGTFLYFKQAASYSRVRQARAAWMDALWADKKVLRRYALFGGAVMQQSDWDAVQLPDQPRFPADFSLSAIRRSHSAEVAADQIHQRLVGVYDKSAAPLRDLQQSYDREGYAQAAGYLASIVGTPPPDDTHLIDSINARISLADKLKGSRPGMNAATASALAGLTQSGDADLQGFAATIRVEFRRQCALTAAGWNGTPQLDTLAQQISSIQNWPTGYDVDRLHRDEKLDPARLKLQDIQHWLATVNQYAWVGPTDMQREDRQKRTAQLASTSGQVRTDLMRFLAADSPQVQKLDQERDTIQKQIDQLGSARFIQKDLPGAIDAPAKHLDEQIASLASRYKYQPGDVATWFSQLQEQHFNSPAAQGAWARWMKDRTPSNIDAAWKTQTLTLSRTLRELESNTFVVPSTLDGEPWATQSQKSADQAAAQAIGMIPQGATELPPDQLLTIKNDFATWCAQAAKLKQEHTHLQRIMIDATAIEQHDARWSSEMDRKFWATQVEGGPFAQIMKIELERMANIRAILAESSEDKLIEASHKSNRPEVTLAVWSRLGTLQKRSFPGPLTAAGIERWTEFLARVNTASEKMLPNPRTAVEKQVAQSAGRMWLSAVNGDSSELLEAASAAAAKLHLAPDTAGLSPVHRFNLALAEALRLNSAENLAALSTQLSALPEWDRAALQQTAGHDDVIQTTLKNRSYLWPAGETERKSKWQSPHINAADQLAKANLLMEDYQPEAAKAALEGLSSADIDALREQIEQRRRAAPAQLKQGNTYFSNHRYPLAFREFQQAARGGSAEAMLKLGQMYREGTGVPRNRNLELKFYRLAATNGNVQAMGELAVTYFSFPQWPIDANAPEVAAWFKTAAEAGNVDAMAGLAQIAIQKHDVEQASRMLTEADAHDPDKKIGQLGSLMRQLARMCEAKSDPDARKWFQAAADRGDAEAQAWLRR